MTEVIITSLVSLLVGAGSTVMFWPQIRKSKILENEARQSEEWRKLYLEEKTKIDVMREQHAETISRKDNKIDELYNKISEQRDCKAELVKENTVLKVENTRLKMLKCEVVNCVSRRPPTGY